MMPELLVLIRNRALASGLAALALSASAAGQDIQFRDGRFLETSAGVTIQRADDASADEAVRNMPFLPGDRVWTDDGGRAEIIFADGEVLWIGERGKVDSLGRGGRDQDERLGLRLFAGSFGVRVRSGGPGFEIQTTGGVITTTGASAFRIDVRAGETLVSVSEGEILANLGGERMTLRGGERARYASGRAEGPYRDQTMTGDSFDRWCEERSQELDRMANRSRNDRLPGELAGYGDELDRNGEWVYDEPQGYVYVPRVAADWSPYTYGRWVYTLYGWTWVDDQPWGFVTSHYGRWGYSAGVGWHWLPRLGFSGAWVSWSTPVGIRWNNTIGWCALGLNDRPISSFSYSGGYGGRGSAATGRGWSFANRSDLGRGSINRRRVDIPADEAAKAVVWNANEAPDRNFREGRRSGDDRGVSRSGGRDGAARIYVRPSPGDSTPELRSDPATTIPTPESRRRPTIGQDGFKEDQDRRGRGRNDSAAAAGVAAAAVIADATRERELSGRRERPPQAEAQPSPSGRGSSRDDAAAQAQGTAERPGRDPLLNRFFRSITRANPAETESGARSNDSSARRSDPQQRDPAARERAQPTPRPSSDDDRERSRPSSSDDSRERTRPAGGERSQPRSAAPPQQKSTPSGGSASGGSTSGSSDSGAVRRRPHNN